METLYFKRYAYYPHALIDESPAQDLFISIVIPCYNEPDIIATLHSLAQCDSPEKGVEIIVVVNHGDHATDDIIAQNNLSVTQIRHFEAEHPDVSLHVLTEFDLPHKHAGVGLARKIGMDEAVRRNPNGVIVCLDADSKVLPNYLQEIERHFTIYPDTPGCSIHFEHPISGKFDAAIYQAIIEYELHLRYFIHAQRWAGHPHAYQTIGSSMAVRSEMYQKVTGMPKRKAGEDFYFLQKVIQLGNFTELKSTMVIPSPRMSDRVPFGTGKAVSERLQTSQSYATYHLNTFVDLKTFIALIPSLYTLRFEMLPVSVQSYMETIGGYDEIKKLVANSPSQAVFEKHFFNWFNAFHVMKFTHHCRDHFYPNSDLGTQSVALLDTLQKKTPSTDLSDLLMGFRELDKKI